MVDATYYILWFMVDDEGNFIEDEPEVITEMLSREQFLAYAGMDHDIKADLMWAYQALGANDLKPEDAPSPGAWFIYATTKDNDLSKKAFISGPVTKLLPSKAQMEKNDRAEDGRKIFSLIEGLLAEPLDDAPVLSRSERAARELAVSRQSA